MKALVVRGGWDGHKPVEATEMFVPWLERSGFAVTKSDTLDCYADPEVMAGTDLVVQCWTQGTIGAEQLGGLKAAVAAGTGLAGWHGGIIDAFRAETDYQFMTGGQFVHHPAEWLTYTVIPSAGHEITAGLRPFEVTSERYTVHVDPAVDVLAHTDIDGVAMPVTWTRTWGSGRVFVTTVGHTPGDLASAPMTAMVTRGMTWAAR